MLRQRRSLRYKELASQYQKLCSEYAGALAGHREEASKRREDKTTFAASLQFLNERVLRHFDTNEMVSETV